MGNSAPTTGADPIDVSGTVSDFDAASMSLVPVADVLVAGIKEAGGPGGSGTSDAQGAFALSIPNQQQVALEGHLEASKAGFHTMRLYPPSPLTTALTDVPLLLLSDGNFSLLLLVAQINQDMNKGEVGLIVVDCANNPISGAVPSLVDENGTDVGSQMVDGSQFQEGLFFFFNVPPGIITVNATFNGNTFRAHDIEVVATTTSSTAVKPGF